MKPLGAWLIVVEDITGAIANTSGIDPDDSPNISNALAASQVIEKALR